MSLCFVVLLIGQFLFAAYVGLYYGSLLVPEGLPGLSQSHIPRNYDPHDPFGNVALAMHLLIAVVVLVGGPLQLIPWVRRRYPLVHRCIGRAYLLSVVVASLSGAYMIWIRGSAVGDLSQHLGLSLNGVLILVFSVLALSKALRRQFAAHRRWALRLFVVGSGVWFSRVGLWLWVKLSGGAGVDFASFTGPFLSVMNFANHLFPLVVLEVYLLVMARKRASEQLIFAVFLMLATAFMVLGIYAAAVRVWIPKM